jgi:phosphoglycerate dehydrogenase-like enzyme
MNTPFGNSITTAEHAISMMLALARQIPQADRRPKRASGKSRSFMGVELFGKTLGVIGCGNIGSIVADRGIGLKMRVIAFDPFLSEERAMLRSASRRWNCRRAVRTRGFHHAAHAADGSHAQYHQCGKASERA